ncbi:MAG: 4-vinyl reductase [Nitrospirae bacterium]|nr:4-vinyl reductase [Nitrospirota bacterium]
MFKEVRTEPMFDWGMIGDITEGRPNLGSTMEVAVYRLMQFTLRDILIKKFSPAMADQIYYEAGELAGKEFCKALINRGNSFAEFINEVQVLLSKLKIGILRVEKADMDKSEFTLTVAEDLDCSGLPMSEETICTYDEGFIAGLLHEFTGTKFKVKEVDCWCSGDRVCRFDVKPEASA